MLLTREEMIRLVPQFCENAAFEQNCLEELEEREVKIFKRAKMGLEIAPPDTALLHDIVCQAFYNTSASILTLDLFTHNGGPWGPARPDDVVIKELAGRYFIWWGDFYGPFLSLQDALAEEFFNVPIPKASISSNVLSHDQVLEVAYAIADWDNGEEHTINDILVNNRRYKLVNHKLVLIA